MSLAATDAVWIDVLPSMKKFGPTLSRGAEDAGKSAGHSAGHLFGVAFAANIASRVVSNAVSGLMGTVKSAIGGGFDRLMNIEQAEIKLETLGLNVKDAMADVGTAVDGTRFAISDAADMAATLGASGVKTGKDMTKWLSLTADTAQFMGSNFGEAQGIVATIAAQGRVTGAELNRLPLAAAALAEHLGIGQDEVRKLASEGKISADVFAEALDKKIGGASKNAGASFLSMRDNIKTAMSATAANFLAPIVDAAMVVMPVILDLAKGMRDAAKPLGEAIGAWLQPRAEALAKSLEKLPTVLKAIYDLVVGGDFTGAFREAFGIEEDHPLIRVILTLRNVGITVFTELTGGIRAFVAAWQYNDGEVTSSGFPGFMERLGYIARTVFGELVGGIRAFAAAWVYNDGEVTSSGFPGFMERLGYIARTVFGELVGGVRAFIAAWQYNDGEVTSSGFPGFMERLGYIARTVFGELTGGIKAFAASWKYNDGEVTSSGFPGFMERAAYAIRQLWEAIRGLDFSSWDSVKTSLGSVGGSGAEGVESISKSFADLSPVLGEVVGSLPDLAKSAGSLAGGALKGLVSVLGFLSRHVDKVVKVLPVLVAGYAAWRVASLALAANSQRLQMAQLAMAPVLLANNSLRLINIILENRATKARLKETAATVANTGATAGNNAAQQTGVLTRMRAAAATVAHRVATVAATVATKAMAAAQRALNLVLRANPIGLIIAAIALLVGALVVLYKNNETVRDVIDKAWAGIKSAVAFVVDWFVQTAWPWIKSVFTSIGDAAKWLYDNAIKPAFTKIKDIAGAVFGWILNTGWPWLKTAFDAIGSVVKWLWDTIYKPYLTLIWDIAKSVFGWILNTGWPWIKTAIDSIGAVVMWLWDKMVKPYFDLIWGIAKSVFGWVKETGWPLMRDAFDSIGSKVRSVWETYISPAFDSIKSGIEAVVGAFESARSGIATVWDKVRGIVAKPIIAVIDFVNTGIIASINKILSWAGIATIPTIPIPESLRAATRGGLPSSGGTVATGPGTWVPGHADGGVLPGYSPGVDNLTFTGPAGRLELSGGEAIMRPEWTRAMGAGWVDAMNRTARTGGVSGVRRALGFARGGIMPGGKGGTLSDLVGLAGSVGESVLGILTSSNPVKWLTDRLLSGIGAIADNPLVGFMRGAVGKMATGVKDKVLGLLGWGSDPDGRTMLAPAAGVPLNWQQIRGLVGAVAPLARMSSGHRPGAITAVGTPSLHGAGRAADFVSGNMMRDFMRVVRLLPWTEAIYSPAGNAQLYRGRPHNYQGITKAMHYDHFHLGMKQGGIFNPFVADSGVTLAPGLNLVNNMLGKPEPLGRLDQPHPSHARPVERHYHAHGPSADELWRLVKARESDEMAMLRVMPV